MTRALWGNKHLIKIYYFFTEYFFKRSCSASSASVFLQAFSQISVSRPGQHFPGNHFFLEYFSSVSLMDSSRRRFNLLFRSTERCLNSLINSVSIFAPKSFLLSDKDFFFNFCAMLKYKQQRLICQFKNNLTIQIIYGISN